MRKTMELTTACLLALVITTTVSGEEHAMKEPPVDQYSFRLGGFNTFAELVRMGVKTLALSSAMSPEQMDEFMAAAARVAGEHGVEIYREPDLLVTDLFPAEVSQGKHVLLIYKGDTLDRYLALKQEKAALVAADRYRGAERRELARKVGHLLSYPDSTIDARLAGTR